MCTSAPTHNHTQLEVVACSTCVSWYPRHFSFASRRNPSHSVGTQGLSPSAVLGPDGSAAVFFLNDPRSFCGNGSDEVGFLVDRSVPSDPSLDSPLSRTWPLRETTRAYNM